jgi:hypothetical protein
LSALEVLDPVSSNFNGAIHIGDSGSNRRLVLEQTDVLTYKMGGTGTSSVTQIVSGGTAGVGSVRTVIDADGNLTHNKGAVFNETGGDNDFRVESDSDSYLLFADASGNGTVNIGGAGGNGRLDVISDSNVVDAIRITGSGGNNFIHMVGNQGQTSFKIYENGVTDPAYLEMYNSNAIQHSIQSHSGGGVTFNEQGLPNDFRVESDGNANMLFVDASANAVGIGTNLPREMLHVSPAGNGEATIALGDRDQVFGGPHGLRFYHQSGSAGDSSYFNYRTGDNTLNIEDIAESQHIKFYTLTGGATFNETGRNDADFRVEGDSTTHALFVDAGNNVVGMGISNPSVYYSNDLVVQAGSEGGITLSSTNTTNSNYFMFADASSGAGRYAGYVQYDHNTNTMIFATNTSPRLHLDGSEVTVNEASNDTDFRVESNNNANAFLIDAGNDLAAFAVKTSLYDGSAGNSPSLIFGGETAAGPQKSIYLDTYYMVHQIHVNEGLKFRFTSGTTASFDDRHQIRNAEVVFNETSQATDFRVESDGKTHMLFVDADTNTVKFGRDTISGTSGQTGVSIDSNGRTISNCDNDWNYEIYGAQTGRLRFFTSAGGGTQVGSITVSTSSTSYNTSSDYRLKENVVELTSATERLKQLQPKRFNFIADAETTVDGFLAHEVSSIVPEAINGEKDAVHDDGTINPQSIDQSKLVPLLVATIKELEARITALENA